jgi:hypothetical protein
VLYPTRRRRAKVAEDRGASFLRHSEFPGDVDDSSIEIFSWARGLKLPLFEVAENRIIGDAEHDVVGRDV